MWQFLQNHLENLTLRKLNFNNKMKLHHFPLGELISQNNAEKNHSGIRKKQYIINSTRVNNSREAGKEYESES